MSDRMAAAAHYLCGASLVVLFLAAPLLGGASLPGRWMLLLVWVMMLVVYLALTKEKNSRARLRAGGDDDG